MASRAQGFFTQKAPATTRSSSELILDFYFCYGWREAKKRTTSRDTKWDVDQTIMQHINCHSRCCHWKLDGLTDLTASLCRVKRWLIIKGAKLGAWLIQRNEAPAGVLLWAGQFHKSRFPRRRDEVFTSIYSTVWFWWRFISKVEMQRMRSKISGYQQRKMLSFWFADYS